MAKYALYNCKFAKYINVKDWDSLRYFLAVAEQGSLSGAAGQLGVNHSTVFRRINQLEESMGVRLFERLADGYQLTQAGEMTRIRVARARDQFDQVSLEVSGQDLAPAGTVRVSAPDSLAYYFVNRYLASFLDQYPGIAIELDVNNSQLNLTRRETDIAVRATPKPPEHLVGRKAVSVPWAFFASSEYLTSHPELSDMGPEDLPRLSRYILIGPDGRVENLAAYRQIEKALATVYRLRSNTLSGIAALATGGNGIALLPDDQIGTGLTRLFPLEPRVTSDIWILVHPELRATTRIRLLAAHLAESFASDPMLVGSG